MTIASTRSSEAVRRRVAVVSPEILAQLISHPRAYNDDPECGGTRFECPRCHWIDHNGGSAFVVDWWAWQCRHCGFDDGSRVELEDAVLHSRTAVFNLMLGASS